jgi:hypothetical protein
MSDAHADTRHASDITSRLSRFLTDVWFGDFAEVTAALHFQPDLLHIGDPETGMNALHIAVGRNNLLMTQTLVEAGAKFIADAHGRFRV